MKITAITKFKHGSLYAALQRLGWTQGELAKRSGIHATAIGLIINLNKRPSPTQADSIQRALGEAGEFLDVLSEWPESFSGIKKGFRVEQTEEIEAEQLENCAEAFQIAAPEETDTSAEEIALGAIETLPERYKQVVHGRFFENKTLDEIGKEIRTHRARVDQILKTSVRKISRKIDKQYDAENTPAPSRWYALNKSSPGHEIREGA